MKLTPNYGKDKFFRALSQTNLQDVKKFFQDVHENIEASIWSYWILAEPPWNFTIVNIVPKTNNIRISFKKFPKAFYLESFQEMMVVIRQLIPFVSRGTVREFTCFWSSFKIHSFISFFIIPFVNKPSKVVIFLPFYQ